MGVISESEVVKPASGRVVDPSEIDPGSVFAPPPTTGQRIKTIGKEATKFAVGTGLPIAASAGASALLGPEAGPVVGGAVRTGAQAIGGAAVPFAESIVGQLFGETPVTPSGKDALKSALWNAAFAGFGEVGAGLTKMAEVEDAVRAEVAKLPQAERTVGKIRQIREALKERTAKETAGVVGTVQQDYRNREFWKAHGLSDDQIDQAVAAPKDVQEELARTVVQADKAKQAYQSVKNVAGENFKTRYNNILGALPETRTDVVPVGMKFEEWGQGASQHELTPTFRGFLQRKGLELTRAGEATGPPVGGVPWKQLPESFKDKLRQQGAASGVRVPGQDFTIQDIRDLRTELREQLPSNPTNLDTKAYRELKTQLDTLEADALKRAGATPEQVGALKALDQEWGRFSETMRAVDPRSEKFGKEVADKLFDPMAKSSGTALNFINYAQQVDKVRPGVMADLRESFLQKAMTEARVPGEPMQELKFLRKLQEQWGGDKESRAVMSAMFGADSPLADPATFTRVVEATSNVEPLALKARQTWGRNILSSPYIQGMVLFGMGAAASGVKGGGLWSAMAGQKGPEAQILAVASLLAGPPLVGWAIRSGNSPVQRAMVAYLTNPNAANAVRWAGKIAGGMSSGMMAIGGPTPATPASPPAPGTPTPAPAP